MPTLTMKAARDLESSFKGRITSSHDAQAEFRGKPTVLIPESTDDVERALRLARAADLRVFIRSGHSVSAVDVGKSAAARKPAAVIVSMEAFRDVEVRDQRVIVGAAAATADVAGKLADTDLFIPLGDNPTQSIVSAVLSMDASPFLRSGAGRGPLRGAVVEAEVVPTDGAGAGRAKTLHGKALRDLLAGGRPAVITKLVFDAAASKTDEPDRWTQAWMTSYQPKAFAALCDALFGVGGGSVPERVDLSVRVTSAAYATKLVIVRVTGHGDADGKAAEAVVQAALDGGKLPVLGANRVADPGSSVAAWVAAGPGSAAPGEVLRRFGSNAAPRSFARFRDKFLDAVDFAIGVSARTGRKRAPGVRAWAELQLAPDGDVVARAEMSDANAAPKVAQEARRRMAGAIPPDKASPTSAVARRALVRRSATRAALRGVEVLPELTPTPGFDLAPSNRVGSAIIPGFRGDVYDSSDGERYHREIQQYAVLSYSPQVVAARMTPRYVALPLNATDVATAVTFAAAHGLKVVTRSGGHQYCGLSSGGSTTLLLDMKHFARVVFSPSTGTPTQVMAGPGVALKDVSKMLLGKGVVVPHGECPLVRLGGHMQTGGIGHQLRSLGAMLDWVSSFKMVTRKQQPGPDVYEERTFTRPPAGGSTGASTDSDVFRAVLGGGPSSWGVLTEITFDLVADTQYPQSEGFSYAWLYESSSTGFGAAMTQLQQWAARQARGLLPQGIDLFLSVVSGDFPRPAVLLVETMCRDNTGVREIRAVVDAVQTVGWLPPMSRHVDGPATLSFIADAGVREIGTFGLPASGREFDLPYKKSLHVTLTSFSNDFCDQFVALVNQVYESYYLKVVVQIVVGGGDFSANGAKKVTHMQRRDGLVQLVFDVFYEPGYEALAERFQANMKGLLNKFSGGADVRMLWGTFEDANTNGTQLDMSRREVQDFYYDSQAEYVRLQQIKAYTDPKDIFHTSFNVQLPVP